MKIKTLLLAVMGLLCLIAISAIAWNTRYVVQDFKEAKRLVYSNQIAEQSLQLSTQLAYERGFTATVLADRNPPLEIIREQLKKERDTSDALYNVFILEIQGIIQLLDSQVLFQNVAKLNRYREQQLKLRAEIDRSLVQGRTTNQNISNGNNTLPNQIIERSIIRSSRHIGSSANAITQQTGNQNISYNPLENEWIQSISDLIEQVRLLRQMIMAPTDPRDFATYYSLIVKEIFHSFTESMGIQRVVIGKVLVAQRSFKKEEIELLLKQESLIQVAEQKLSAVLQFFPPSEEIQRSREAFVKAYHLEYKNLYEQILAASDENQPYPITAFEWFSQATEAIDSVLTFSLAIDNLISGQVNKVKEQSNFMVYSLLATIILVGSLFIIAYFMTYRRIVNPLAQLEKAATRMSNGNLEHAILLESSDEFSRLGDTFDLMRRNLLDDIRQREMVEMELRKLHNAMLHSLNSVVITDSEGLVEYVNPCFEAASGYTLAEIAGSKFNQIRHSSTPIELFKEMWDTIKKGQIWEGEIQNQKKNGEFFWNMLSIAPVKNGQNSITHFISTHHDITERKAMEKRLNFLAYHDELTGLPNRTLLIDRFNQTCSRAKRSGHQLALLVLDLDRFKNINDTLGHSTGDKVLIEIAERLKEQARGGETITRYGGDEFVILLSDVQESKTIANASQRILDIISEPIELDGRTLHVTCSLGVAIWPDNGDDLPALLSHADAAMYKAKQHGRDRFQFFTEELNSQNQKRMEMENDLHAAIENREFELFYQPQIDTTNGTIFGAEALIRWNHPKQGIISPASFIPLAEETGMILAIGQWVLETACQQAIKWKEQGFDSLLLSINVSVRQLEEPDFDMLLREILKKTKLPADNLELEITESTMMQDPEYMITVLDQLSQVGVKLALDDFGTGHSSLAYLQRFHFDKLKIDRSFINHVADSTDAAAIAKTIGAMAKSLHLEIIAEGVETQQQVDFLTDCGCNQVQGFFYSEAVPVERFEYLLDKQRSKSSTLNQSAPSTI